MKNILKIPQNDYKGITEVCQDNYPNEVAFFGLVGISKSPGQTSYLVRRFIEIPQKSYRIQSSYHLNIEPQAINGLISLAEENDCGILLSHSHIGDVDFSITDDYGENNVFTVFREFKDQKYPTISLLLKENNLSGRIWNNNDDWTIFDEITIIGSRINSFHQPRHLGAIDEKLHDRQIRIFGKYGQEILSKLSIGVVGVGGIGSSIVEQLARLGIRSLILSDPDTIEISNISRIYGSYYHHQDEKKLPKVKLVKHHVEMINPRINVLAIYGKIQMEITLAKFKKCDLIFLCTDNHWSRAVLNQFSYQHLIPTINIGMRIASENNLVAASNGVIDLILPDKPCLWCSRSIDGNRIAVETYPKEDQGELADEGYVENIDVINPSVISINTTLAGLAVTEFLNLFLGLRPIEFDTFNRLNYHIEEGTIRRGQTPPQFDCICRKVLGFGDLKNNNTI